MAQARDDDLQVALTQFNEGLEQQRAQQREQQAIEKAERRKQQAASALKKIQSDPGASGDDRAAAEAAYRSAVEEFNRVRSNGPATADTPE